MVLAVSGVQHAPLPVTLRPALLRDQAPGSRIGGMVVPLPVGISRSRPQAPADRCGDHQTEGEKPLPSASCSAAQSPGGPCRRAHRPPCRRGLRPHPGSSTVSAAISWGSSPALERALDFTNHGPLVLISQYQPAAGIRAAGPAGLERHRRSHRVRGAARLANTAAQAAAHQQIRIRGEAVAAALIAELAAVVLDLNRQLAQIDALIKDRFRAHRDAPVIASMAGIGDLLGAELLATTGGTLAGSMRPRSCEWPAIWRTAAASARFGHLSRNGNDRGLSARLRKALCSLDV